MRIADFLGLAKVVISAGPVNMYADGDVLIGGSGVVNETQVPSNLVFYGTSSVDRRFDIGGLANFYGAIYAPTSEINLSGNGEIYGSVIGHEINTNGLTRIHYDETLRDILGSGSDSSSGKYSVENWQEI